MRSRPATANAASPRKATAALAARALGLATAAACLCAVAACASAPDTAADTLIDLHMQAVMLQKPAAHPDPAGPQSTPTTNDSGLPSPGRDSTAYNSRN